MIYSSERAETIALKLALLHSGLHIEIQEILDN